MWINLHVHPLNFHDFPLISNIFINIHEYTNLIICISEHWMKVLCLNIQLVPKKNRLAAPNKNSNPESTPPYLLFKVQQQNVKDGLIL